MIKKQADVRFSGFAQEDRTRRSADERFQRSYDAMARARRAPSLRQQVLMAARQRCDEMQDGPQEREDMKRDVLATPDELLPGLLAALSSVRIDRALFLSTTKEVTP